MPRGIRLTPEQREVKRLADRSRTQRWTEAVDSMKNKLESAKEAAEELVECLKEELDNADGDPEVADPSASEEQLDGVRAHLLGFSLSDLEDLRGEYESWRDNLPEQLQESPVGEKLNEVCDADIDIEEPGLADGDIDSIESFIEECNSAIEKLEELENIDLPLGFGRD
jgi:hypothetical protein